MSGSYEKILLFYDGFEKKAIDAPWGRAVSNTHGLARRVYRSLRRRQPYTGYYTAFLNLVRSLEAQGLDVRINDFASARSDPRHPIALCGYRSIFDSVRLPNPALVFHADFGYPDEVETVTASCNARLFALGCDWSCRLYEAHLADRIRPLFVAIDTEAWPDLSEGGKSVDYLIYDKIRWRRAELEPELLEITRDELNTLGRSHETIRYGHHSLVDYRNALARARAMIFLCEHETQGLAYQEAMSSGLPILAWDEGDLIDPRQKLFLPEGETVSSVPYFDESCGATFKKSDLRKAIPGFDRLLGSFRPRAYVERELSLSKGATAFLSLYEEAGVGIDAAPSNPTRVTEPSI